MSERERGEKKKKKLTDLGQKLECMTKKEKQKGKR